MDAAKSAGMDMAADRRFTAGFFQFFQRQLRGLR